MDFANIFEKWDAVLFNCYNLIYKFIYIFKFHNLHKVLKKNEFLKDIYKDERCFIVLNGPSLNNYDLSKISDEFVFSTNYFYKSNYFDTVKPNFHCAIDNNFFDVKHNDKMKMELVNLINSREDCKFIFGTNYLENFNLEDNVYITFSKHMPNIWGVKNNLSSISSNFSSVSLYAINAAIYMGFKEIYLLGYDFEPGIFKHFYEDSKFEELLIDAERKEINKSKICGRYWGYTLAQYQNYYMRKMADSKKINIRNANSNSFVRAFDFVDYNSLFNKNDD